MGILFVVMFSHSAVITQINGISQMCVNIKDCNENVYVIVEDMIALGWGSIWQKPAKLEGRSLN